ncbi:MAG: transcriptional regulator [Thermoplasmataceae archaeon]
MPTEPEMPPSRSETINDLLLKLSQQLSEPAMKSTARLMILITLALNGKMTFSDLLAVTALGKGSLSNHLEKLNENGLIKVRTVFRIDGPRLLVEITEEGLNAYRNYSAILEKLMGHR